MAFLFKKFKIPPGGLLPSPPDSRDLLLSYIQSPVPIRELPENYIIPYVLPVMNQGQEPSCVGFSCALIKGEKERREQNQIDFDGSWIYKKAKEIDGIPNTPGTFFRIGLKVLKDFGAKPLDQPEIMASKYKIGAYVKVDDTSLNGLKSAIYQNGVILSGFIGSNEGWQSAYIRPPKAGEKTWGHAIAFIGWKKDYLIFQNSWGLNWGDKGLGYVNVDVYPVLEAWSVLVDLPNDLIFQEEKPKYFFNKDLKLGDKGEDVMMLQKCLKYEKVFPKAIVETGYFGQITLKAVQLFQLTYGITPANGYVGILTRAKLNDIFS